MVSLVKLLALVFMVEFLKKVFTFTLHIFTEAICLLYRFQELRQTTTSFRRLWFSHPVFFSFLYAKCTLRWQYDAVEKGSFFVGCVVSQNLTMMCKFLWRNEMLLSHQVLCSKLRQPRDTGAWH